MANIVNIQLVYGELISMPPNCVKRCQSTFTAYISDKCALTPFISDGPERQISGYRNRLAQRPDSATVDLIEYLGQSGINGQNTTRYAFVAGDGL